MGPKKKDGGKKKAKESDEPGQKAEDLLSTYTAFVKKIGLPSNLEVVSALSNEENPFKGKQIIIDGGDASKTSQPLGPGGCRALATAIMGVGQGMPKHPETGSNLLYKPLQELRIWGANIGDDGASSIAELLRLGGAEIQLQYLELTNNEITEVGGFALGRSLSCMMNMSLITLALDYNMSFGSEGVAALCLGLRTNSTLKKLSLKYCNLDGDAGGPLGEVLAFTRSGLNILDIQGNHVGGKGLLDMCPGLQRNKSLTQLVLADNDISEAEVDNESLKKFAEVLLIHPTLTSVNLLYNRFGGAGEYLVPAVDPASGGNKNITEFRVDASLHDELYEKLNKMGGGGKKGKKGKKKCDGRLKENFRVLEEGGEFRPAVYEFNNKGEEGREVGVVAQELVGTWWERKVSVECDEVDGVHFQVDKFFVDELVNKYL
ncbi:hypothetical protein TL16_g12351 [Triparma laevis f. inornata]|uniref:Uncharacterized protein n=1 Tax=Triparma laevis f. inornata TaxID=1714386 RepID=A0A9W7BTH1_9STRA|nr:hypothetical protein TL16_g12351 [Triparma laevis f. inornata]